MLLIKTEAGQLAFKERSARFSPRQRSMFILIDGKKSTAQLLVATTGMGVTQADVDYMVHEGFLRLEAGSAPVPSSVVLRPSPVQATAPTPLERDESGPAPLAGDALNLTDQERYLLAKALATKLTASLGLRGFMLNLSVESASGYQAMADLFPQIKKAVGESAARELQRALRL